MNLIFEGKIYQISQENEVKETAVIIYCNNMATY